MEKELYLKKYRPDITFISMEEVKRELSEDWINILSESDTKIRNTKTLSLWKREMAKELRNTADRQELLLQICCADADPGC